MQNVTKKNAVITDHHKLVLKNVVFIWNKFLKENWPSQRNTKAFLHFKKLRANLLRISLNWFQTFALDSLEAHHLGIV